MYNDRGRNDCDPDQKQWRRPRRFRATRVSLKEIDSAERRCARESLGRRRPILMVILDSTRPATGTVPRGSAPGPHGPGFRGSCCTKSLHDNDIVLPDGSAPPSLRGGIWVERLTKGSVAAGSIRASRSEAVSVDS